jgi:hypothetical protein
MRTRYRNVLGVAAASVALGLSVGASAGVGANGKVAEQIREQKQEQRQEQQRQEQPRPQQAQPQRPQMAAQPQSQGRGREMQGRPGGRGDVGRGDAGRQPQVIGRVGPSPVYGNARNDNRGNGGNWNNGHRPPPRVINRLPGGYRDYHWNGNRYYYSGGSWYRPYGSSFVSIGVPYGLFVTTLPGAYNSFWYGGSRYFYADDTYYTYEPVRRGYVVTRSPYGDDQDEYADENSGDDLFIYPARGQSEKQQADDRYECHRWAANEAHYDPVDDDYDASLREDYQRAQAACLTGRGYTVK